MKSAWVTTIIVIIWIATTITIITQDQTNVLMDLMLVLIATFYMIIFGLQKQAD